MIMRKISYFFNYFINRQRYRVKHAIKQKEIKDIKLRVDLTEKKSKEIFEDNMRSTVDKSISRFDLQKLEDEIPEIEEEELLPEVPADGIVNLHFKFLKSFIICNSYLNLGNS